MLFKQKRWVGYPLCTVGHSDKYHTDIMLLLTQPVVRLTRLFIQGVEKIWFPGVYNWSEHIFIANDTWKRLLWWTLGSHEYDFWRYFQTDIATHIDTVSEVDFCQPCKELFLRNHAQQWVWICRHLIQNPHLVLFAKSRSIFNTTWERITPSVWVRGVGV